MVTRKYVSEFGLNMNCNRSAILTHQEEMKSPKLSEYFDPEHPCHIYIIGRRPRIGLEPSTFNVKDGIIKGHFRVQRQDKVDLVPFACRNRLGNDDVILDCPYPYTEYRIRDKAGTLIHRGIASMFMTSLGTEFSPQLSLEVLYIGQSFGEEGERTAPDRLASHSTLQGIYAEAIHRAPDQEIAIILCSFEAILITFIDPTQDAQTSLEQDTLHIDQVLAGDVTEQQQINFTEAALIRYFQPSYNEIFKNSFPNPAHKTYSQCYDIDLNGILVELKTEPIGCQLWSQAVKPQWDHLPTFPLHDSSERKSMFEF